MPNTLLPTGELEDIEKIVAILRNEPGSPPLTPYRLVNDPATGRSSVAQKLTIGDGTAASRPTLILNSDGPILYYGVSTGGKENWKIGAQDAVDHGLEIAVGTPNADPTASTYTNVLTIDSSGNLRGKATVLYIADNVQFDAFAQANPVLMYNQTNPSGGRSLTLDPGSGTTASGLILLSGATTSRTATNEQILMYNQIGTNYERFGMTHATGAFILDSTFNGIGIPPPTALQSGGSVGNAIGSRNNWYAAADGSFDLIGSSSFVAQTKTWYSVGLRVSDPENTGNAILNFSARSGTPANVATDSAFIRWGRGGVNKWIEGLNANGTNADNYEVVALSGAGKFILVGSATASNQVLELNNSSASGHRWDVGEMFVAGSLSFRDIDSAGAELLRLTGSTGVVSARTAAFAGTPAAPPWTGLTLGYGTGTPQLGAGVTSGEAAVSVYTNDGTRNTRVKLFLDDTNGVMGIYQNGGIERPFVLSSVNIEYLRYTFASPANLHLMKGTGTGRLRFGSNANAPEIMDIAGPNGQWLQLQPMTATGGTTGIGLVLAPGDSVNPVGATTSQILLYNVTGANYERFEISWNNNGMTIGPSKLGTGNIRPVTWYSDTAGTAAFVIDTAGGFRVYQNPATFGYVSNNRITLAGAADGATPVIGVTGVNDANVDLRFTPKGAGVFDLNYAAVALGGGAAPTFGTIGGSGPATAAQNSWLKVKIAGTVSYIPVWR